uniref:Uncharacterized protein n=1 Tax=Acrobeloides nanus TaxID=290746 RepID=A0A914CYF0_9BILA
MTEVVKEVIMLAREMLQTWKQQQEFLLESFSEHMTLGRREILDSFDLKFQTLAEAIEGYESHMMFTTLDLLNLSDDQNPGSSQPAVFSQSSTNMYLSQEASQAYDPYGGFLQSYHDGSYGGAYGDGQFFESYGSQYYPTQFWGDSTFTQMATLYFNYVQDMERKLKWCKYRVVITGWDNLSKQLQSVLDWDIKAKIVLPILLLLIIGRYEKWKD